MAIKNVAIAGASGRLGPAVLNQLVSAGTFNVTMLMRASSTAEPPPHVRVVRISDSFPEAELEEVLRGQDAVVSTIYGTLSDVQIRLANAAAKAGVKRFVPSDYGSCDSSSERALELVPVYKDKQKVRHHLMKLASDGPGNLTWTSLVCGHFFDWGLSEGFLHFDCKAMKAEILDDGSNKWSATNLDTIGLAVVRILQREEETKNKMLYIQSVNVSQNEVLEKLKVITGKEWKVERLDSEKFIEEHKSASDNGDKEAMEEVVFAQGLLDGNWEGKDDFANELLGLGNEDLEQVIRKAIA